MGGGLREGLRMDAFLFPLAADRTLQPAFPLKVGGREKVSSVYLIRAVTIRHCMQLVHAALFKPWVPFSSGKGNT